MRKNIAGNSFLSVLFFMLALGLLMAPLAGYYKNWQIQKRITETAERLDAINSAVREFAAANGHFPCPADITAGFDTAGFGQSVSNECNNGSATGQTKRSASKAKADGSINAVRAGAVPVRTLGLPDKYIADGYDHRYFYIVTEAYATTSPLPDLFDLDQNQKSGVFVQDTNENSATRSEGNAVYVVLSMGDTKEGSYSANGALLAPCPPDVLNCSMTETVMNTINNSDAEGPNKFTQTMRYDTPQPCIPSENTPEKIAFLVDTSGSMSQQGGVVTTLPLTEDDIAPNPQWRIHTAQWAMRRALMARNAAMSPENDPNRNNTTTVASFFTQMPFTYSTEGSSHIENTLSNPSMCPRYGTGTPIAAHMTNLANDIGAAEEGRPPNKVIILCDGSGDPVNVLADALRDIYDEHGDGLQINFIDVVGTAQITNAITQSGIPATAATHVTTTSPSELVDELLKSSNGCNIARIPEPENERYYCGPQAEPTCEELGTCECDPVTDVCTPIEEPTCEELGTCPCTGPSCTPDPDPITLNGFLQIAIPVAGNYTFTLPGDTFKLMGYDQTIGRVDNVRYDGAPAGTPSTNIVGPNTAIEGSLGTLQMNQDGTFNFVSLRNASGVDTFRFSAVITNPGPSNGISVVPLALLNQGGTASASGSLYSLVPLANQVLSRVTSVEVNGVEGSVPATGSAAFTGTNGRLTISEDGNFTYRGISGRSGMDFFYVKGPILATGTPLEISNPTPLSVANSYRWEMTFRVRNGNGGRALTGNLINGVAQFDDRTSGYVESVAFNSTTYPLTGQRLIISGTYGRLNMRRDGYFTYTPNLGVSGTDTFFANGLVTP